MATPDFKHVFMYNGVMSLWTFIMWVKLKDKIKSFKFSKLLRSNIGLIDPDPFLYSELGLLRHSIVCERDFSTVPGTNLYSQLHTFSVMGFWLDKLYYIELMMFKI